MKKPKIILLHGWAISAQNKTKWHAFRELLSKQGIESRFLELPGLSTPLSEPWGLSDYVAWLERELSGEKEVILLGHSFGGQLAVRYTATHPKQIKKLILIGSAGLRDKSLKARLKRGFFYCVAKVGKPFFSHPQIKKLFYKVIGEHDYETASPVMKKTMSTLLADEIRTDLKLVACPVKLIWGSNDTSAPYKNTTFFLEHLSEATLCTIQNARHSPHYTHTKEVVVCISEFLS